MKRLTCILLPLFVLVSLIVTIGSVGAADRKVIKFMHPDTEKPERAQYYVDMAAAFEKANPDIDVQVTGVAFADLQKNYLTTLAAGDPYDICRAGNGDVPFYLSKGVLLDLTPYFTMSWRLQLNPGVIDAITAPDKNIYIAPQYIDALPLNYHKEILAKYGLQVPTDRKSYFAVMDALKSNGIENPMQLHGSMSDDFFNIISLQFTAKDGLNPYGLSSGTAPFNSKTIIEALKLYKEMYDKGYLARNFWSIGGTDGRMGYAQGKHAMKMGFFWDVYTHKDMGMPFENQGVAPFPNLVGGKINRPVTVFGFFVTKTTKYPKECAKWLKFLSDEYAQTQCANKYFGGALGMPVVNRKVVYPSDYTKVYADQVKGGTPYNIFAFNPQVWDYWSANIGALMQGQKTVEQFADGLEALRAKLTAH